LHSKLSPFSFVTAAHNLIQQALTKETGKSFDFPKQHATSHVLDDIRGVGVTANSTTRTGEGMHQEVRQAYEKTNGKDVEAQVRSFWRSFTMVCTLNV
jgi:hypothetical protein